MFGRLREIDDELAQLPDQLAPLETQVERGREILHKSEQANPMRQPLALLLKQSERVHIENLGWLVGQQSIDPAAVAAHVVRFLLTVAGKPPPAAPPAPAPEGVVEGPQANPYDAALAEFVRVEGGGLPPGMLEGSLLRKLFAEPWLATDSSLRAHLMEELKRETADNSRWLPEPKAQILDEEGKSLVGEGAGAFGGYFSAAALVAVGLRSYRLQPPTRAFSAISATLALIAGDNVFPKLNGRFAEAATTAERGRALMAIAYVHLVRSIQMGTYEREHRKIVDAVGSAEVALESGRKRLDRLRTARSELVLQSAGLIGLTVTIVAIMLYVLYSMLLAGEQPPKQ